MIKWTLKTFNISDLKDYEKNPRKLTKEQFKHLKESLSKFGLIDKPVCTSDGRLIGGHQRKKVLQDLAVKEVECYVPDRELTEKEIEELCIRLNKATGEWDWDILANDWEVEDLLEWGFTEEELTGQDVTEIRSAGEEDNEVLEPGKDEDAITKLGDIYEVGDHRLVCGDSTNSECVNSCLGGVEPILMVTDPPYGVNYDPKWRDVAGKGCRAKGKVQNDDKINWALAWHLFPGSVAYIWHACWHAAEVQTGLLDAEYEIISQIIWVKQHFALSRGDYHFQHEPCWYAVKKGHKHNWQGARDQSTTWEISNLNAFGKGKEEGDERTAHSTQKPLECMARPIRNNTAKGEGVYDPFCGSGTTLIASEMLGRKAYCIELSPAYCDIIVNRWIKNRKNNGLSAEVKKNGIVCKEFE